MSKEFQPFISATSKTPEFTLRAILLGLILGVIFGVGNCYLGLKVGTTISASIPAAVLSMAILRLFFKKVSILENNIVQTIASIGEGLSGGIVFTIPALFLLGAPPEPSKIFLLSLLGGILGVLFMIPMRRYIIIKEHNVLKFPEGTACAEILKSGESGRSKALLALFGIVIGSFYKICSSGLSLWKETISWMITPFQRTVLSIDCTPALMGVGFIIGPRTSSLILSGGLLAWVVFIPLIKLFGGHLIYPGTVPVSLMDADDIWSNYIRYIGAGCVAFGGVIGLVNIAPIIWKTFHSSIQELFKQGRSSHPIRTDRDISLRWLLLGSTAIILFLWLYPGFPMNFLTVAILVLLGFFFVAVTSLTVGIIGSSTCPTSGMTITTLLLTCLIFVSLGWTERIYLISALTMAVVANVAISLAGTTAQDLKTGYLLGATPKAQQIAEMIGLTLPAAAISGTLLLLNQAYQFGSPALPAPQGAMMALIAKGVIHGDIPYTLVTVGVMIGLILHLLRISVLPFAIGLYLPLSLSTPVFVGGCVAYVLQKLRHKNEATIDRGILISSGLIAGDACTGVILALLSVIGWISPSTTHAFGPFVSLSCFGLLALILGYFSFKKTFWKS